MQIANFKKKLAKIVDINIFITISLSDETIQYAYVMPKIVSLAHKDP